LDFEISLTRMGYWVRRFVNSGFVMDVPDGIDADGMVGCVWTRPDALRTWIVVVGIE
jgi:hypothetical protein